jgi:hypothetical protein
VLEFAGDSFAADFGVVDYSNPIVEELKTAQRHNMLAPWSLGLRARPTTPSTPTSARVGGGDETAFRATMDVTAGWEGWFKKWQRTWDSPTPDRLIITDEWGGHPGRGRRVSLDHASAHATRGG